MKSVKMIKIFVASYFIMSPTEEEGEILFLVQILLASALGSV